MFSIFSFQPRKITRLESTKELGDFIPLLQKLRKKAEELKTVRSFESAIITETKSRILTPLLSAIDELVAEFNGEKQTLQLLRVVR